jgi:hypothetical protein
MKLSKRSLGQQQRRGNEKTAKGLIDLFIGLLSLGWTISKWTIFLPITLLFVIFKKN